VLYRFDTLLVEALGMLGYAIVAALGLDAKQEDEVL